MKHLIETADPSVLPSVLYDRIILDSTKNEIIYRGGVINANILMLSKTGYQLFGEEGDDSQINYWVYEYTDKEEYNGKEYFKYVFTSTDFVTYILAPTRNITKVTFPFDNYYISYDGEIVPLSGDGCDSLYGFTSVPENKVVMKRRTDIGTNANGKDYVDLGLTSGTLWATMNVGATSETDFGSYFQWGETEPHSTDIPYDWANYKYCNGTAGTTDENVKFTKYNTLTTYGENPDGKITLDLEDDAARANMGGDWRMPSIALMEELVEETTNEWTQMNGVNGYKFTSKADPSKYIFIPASGERVSGLGGQNLVSLIWGSSLYTPDSSRAWSLYFNSDKISTGLSYRCDGFTVRGVL